MKDLSTQARVEPGSWSSQIIQGADEDKARHRPTRARCPPLSSHGKLPAIRSCSLWEGTGGRAGYARRNLPRLLHADRMAHPAAGLFAATACAPVERMEVRVYSLEDHTHCPLQIAIAGREARRSAVWLRHEEGKDLTGRGLEPAAPWITPGRPEVNPRMACSS